MDPRGCTHLAFCEKPPPLHRQQQLAACVAVEPAPAPAAAAARTPPVDLPEPYDDLSIEAVPMSHLS